MCVGQGVVLSTSHSLTLMSMIVIGPLRDSPVWFSISDQLLYRNVQLFRGGLVLKAHRILHRPTSGLRAINKRKKTKEKGVRVGVYLTRCIY